MQIFAQGLLQVHSISVSDETTISQLKGILNVVSMEKIYIVCKEHAHIDYIGYFLLY